MRPPRRRHLLPGATRETFLEQFDSLRDPSFYIANLVIAPGRTPSMAEIMRMGLIGRRKVGVAFQFWLWPDRGVTPNNHKVSWWELQAAAVAFPIFLDEEEQTWRLFNIFVRCTTLGLRERWRVWAVQSLRAMGFWSMHRVRFLIMGSLEILRETKDLFGFPFLYIIGTDTQSCNMCRYCVRVYPKPRLAIFFCDNRRCALKIVRCLRLSCDVAQYKSLVSTIRPCS